MPLKSVSSADSSTSIKEAVHQTGPQLPGTERARCAFQSIWNARSSGIQVGLIDWPPLHWSRFSCGVIHCSIDSLVVCTTEVKDLSRMCIVLRGQDGVVEQARRQLEDLVRIEALAMMIH